MQTRLGQYEIVAKLGEGGMGAVYKARQLDIGRIVALKLMTARAAGSQRSRQRFVVEAKAMAKLRHPNIASVFEVGEVRGQLFMAMDFVEGEPLHEVIDQGLPAFQQSVEWMIKICSAVHEAHRKGIIHRDLKPHNIMVDSRGEPIVMDFGIAKDLGAGVDLTRPGGWVGTPNYMSPEQAQGRDDLDARADVYSLGGVLFSLLTGRPPFTGTGKTAVILAVMEEDAEPPSAYNPLVPPELDVICLKCLRKEREARYESAGAFASDLLAFGSGQALSARTEVWLARVARLFSRPRFAVPAGVLGALALAAIIIQNLGALLPKPPSPALDQIARSSRTGTDADDKGTPPSVEEAPGPAAAETSPFDEEAVRQLLAGIRAQEPPDADSLAGGLTADASRLQWASRLATLHRQVGAAIAAGARPLVALAGTSRTGPGAGGSTGVGLTARAGGLRRPTCSD
ncbi:protein kinase, partial [PVC group bacterium]|nr:protein kinase [PVC group bacterium]